MPDHPENHLPSSAQGDAVGAPAADFDWDAASMALHTLGVCPDWQSRYDLRDAVAVLAAGESVAAHDTRFDRPVVIRRITEPTAGQKKDGPDILHVIRSWALVRHQSIAGIVDYGRDAEGVFLVNEAVDGKSLTEVLTTGPLELSAAIDAVFHFCDTVVKIDSQGCAIGVLRPDHLVLTSSGCLKLVGFDWGDGVVDSLLGTENGVGYCPPEQRTQAVQSDGRAQVWSLAALLFHLLTGKLPVTSDLPSDEILEAVEVPVRSVLAKALQPNPELRYAEVIEFQSALRLVGDELRLAAVDGTPAIKGACRCCGEINQVDRAFCVACGEKLRETCLGCDADNEVWAQYCGKCGSQLKELVVRQQCDLDEQKRCVESARRAHDYPLALERISPLLLIQHEGLSQVHDWAVQMKQTLQTEAADEQSRAELLVRVADQAFQDGKYGDARKVLDQVPQNLRSDQASVLSEEASARLDQAELLIHQMGDAIARKEPGRLWRYTEKYLALYPKHPVMTRIHESVQCHKHEDAALMAEIMLRAKQAFGETEYQRTLAALEELSEGEQQDPPVQQLRTMAKNRLEQIGDIKASISESDDVHDLLGLVDELFELQPNDVVVQELRDDLIEEAALVDRQTASRHRQRLGGLAVLAAAGIFLLTAAGWVWSRAERTQLATLSDGPAAPADVSRQPIGKLKAEKGKQEPANEGAALTSGVASVKSKKSVSDTKPAVAAGQPEVLASTSPAGGTTTVTPVRRVEESVTETDAALQTSVVSSAGAAEAPAKEVQETPASAPFSAQQAVAYQQAWADAFQVPVGLTNSIGLKLRLVPAGEFLMGSALDVADRGQDEKQHAVALSAPYYLGVYEVTQAQYEQVMGENNSKFRGPDRPVEQVSWHDAAAFCAKLTALPAEKAAGHVYRLPTEAEWEYACRAGTVTPYNAGDSDDSLSNAAWFNGNTEATQPVGQKQPNAFGLFDMSGNVWEWCQDRYGPYDDEHVRDPQGSSLGNERVNRGGSWINLPQVCRSASRSRFSPERSYTVLGFRVLCLPVDR